MNLAALLGQTNIQNAKEAATQGNGIHGQINAGGDPKIFMQELMAAQAEAAELKSLKVEQSEAVGESAELLKTLKGQKQLEAKLKGLLGKAEGGEGKINTEMPTTQMPTTEMPTTEVAKDLRINIGKSIESPHVDVESLLGEKAVEGKKVVKVGVGAAPLGEAMDEQAQRKSLFMSKEKLQNRSKLVPTTSKAKNIQTLLGLTR